MSNKAQEKEYMIFLGNFGSGKTELAMHFAIDSAAAGNPTTLIDLDVINPYFRASERKLALDKAGVRLVTPNYALSNVEIITINPEIYSAFTAGAGSVIFDVGGDGLGARALGQYKGYFDKVPPPRLRIWLVINPHRPMSATSDKIISMMRAIEESARLRINGLINNGNMSYESTAEDILHSYYIVEEVSKQTGVPVIMTSGEEQPLNDFLSLAQERELKQEYLGEPVFIHTKMHRDWDRFVKYGF